MRSRRLASAALGLWAALLVSVEAQAGGWGRVHVMWGPRIGVRVQPMTPELREYFKVEGEAGVLVAQVDKESPAEEAGIRPGDVLVEADGRPIRHPGDLVRAIRSAGAGETVRVGRVREGKREDVEVRVGEGEREWHGGFHGPLLPPEGLAPELLPEYFGPDVEEALKMLRERLEDLERRLEDLEKDLPRQEEQRT